MRSDTFDAEVVPGRDYFITFTLSDPGKRYQARAKNAARIFANLPVSQHLKLMTIYSTGSLNEEELFQNICILGKITCSYPSC